MGVEMLIQGQKVWKEQKSENSALHCPLRKKKETAKASRLLAGRVKKKIWRKSLKCKVGFIRCVQWCGRNPLNSTRNTAGWSSVWMQSMTPSCITFLNAYLHNAFTINSNIQNSAPIEKTHTHPPVALHQWTETF